MEGEEGDVAPTFTDPLSGFTPTPANIAIGTTVALGIGLTVSAAVSGLGPVGAVFGRLGTFMFGRNLNQRVTPTILSTLAENEAVGLLVDNPFPTGLPPAGRVSTSDVVRGLMEGARLQDNPFPRGLPVDEPLPYMLPLDVALGRPGRGDFTLGYVNSAHTAANALSVSVSDTGAFSVNQDGTITNVFGETVGNTQISPPADPSPQGPAPGEVDA
jgi:hypothetical protein